MHNMEKQKDYLAISRLGGIGGLTERQRQTLRGLGLTKNYKRVLVEDTNATRGMVNKVIHWVDVELVSHSEVKKVRAEILPKSKNPGYKVTAKKG